MSDPYTLGRGLSIPTVLISKENGEILQKFYRENKGDPNILKQIRLEVDFQVELRSDTVQYELFYSGNTYDTYNLLVQLAEMNKQFGQSVEYTSRYLTSSSSNYRTSWFNEENNCLVKGKYCPYPSDSISTKFSPNGADYITYHLKERCVQIFICQNNLSTNFFWDYILGVFTDCQNNIGNANKCIDDVLDKMPALDRKVIVECYMGSFDPKLLSGNIL
jgi:hypothetical protein